MPRLRKPQFVRVDRPPPLGDVMHVARVKETGRICGVVVSLTIWGTFTHWMEGRTRKCIGIDNQCSACKLHLPKRWVGFVQIWDPDRDASTLLELTQVGGLRLQEIHDKHQGIRGLVIEARRERACLKSPLIIEVIRKYDGEKPLPREKPIEPTLHRLWGYIA